MPTIRHLCTLYPTSSILFFMAQYLPAVYSIDMPWPDLYSFTASFTRTVGKVFVHIDSWWAFLLKPGVCLFWQPISQAWVNRRGSSGRRAIPWSETAFNESQKWLFEDTTTVQFPSKHFINKRSIVVQVKSYIELLQSFSSKE